MKKQIFAVLLLAITCSCCADREKKIIFDSSIPESEYNVFVVADAGRNGAYDQTRIGQVLGVYADKLEPEYVLNAGDMFHYDGVQSIDDPLFISNFESIYPHGELQCKWWGVLGNHEYRGNTQAVIDYTNRSRRWNIPSQYYSKTFEGTNETDSVCVVFIDSAPLIDKYHIEEDYPDARKQDPDKQVAWIDSTLSASTAKWKIVIGHHPIYSYSKKNPEEAAQMQKRLAGIYAKNDVDISLAGHVHTFQHLRDKTGVTDYFVAPSASLGRDVIKTGDETIAAVNGSGFLVLGFNEDRIAVSFIDADGKMKYTYNITK